MTSDHPTPFYRYCKAITHVFRLSVTLQLLSYSCPPYPLGYMVSANTMVSSKLLYARASSSSFFLIYSSPKNSRQSNLSWKIFEPKELYENISTRTFNIQKFFITKISQTTIHVICMQRLRVCIYFSKLLRLSQVVSVSFLPFFSSLFSFFLFIYSIL